MSKAPRETAFRSRNSVDGSEPSVGRNQFGDDGGQSRVDLRIGHPIDEPSDLTNSPVPGLVLLCRGATAVPRHVVDLDRPAEFRDRDVWVDDSSIGESQVVLADHPSDTSATQCIEQPHLQMRIGRFHPHRSALDHPGESLRAGPSMVVEAETDLMEFEHRDEALIEELFDHRLEIEVVHHCAEVERQAGWRDQTDAVRPGLDVIIVEHVAPAKSDARPGERVREVRHPDIDHGDHPHPTKSPETTRCATGDHGPWFGETDRSAPSFERLGCRSESIDAIEDADQDPLGHHPLSLLDGDAE
ncbi:MAG: hypothetical protein NTZ21_19410 [Actinobacteria bacterium]|nr:hypothetical protein [Actinomycetota bacterium]